MQSKEQADIVEIRPKFIYLFIYLFVFLFKAPINIFYLKVHCYRTYRYAKAIPGTD